MEFEGTEGQKAGRGCYRRRDRRATGGEKPLSASIMTSATIPKPRHELRDVYCALPTVFQKSRPSSTLLLLKDRKRHATSLQTSGYCGTRPTLLLHRQEDYPPLSLEFYYPRSQQFFLAWFSRINDFIIKDNSFWDFS